MSHRIKTFRKVAKLGLFDKIADDATLANSKSSFSPIVIDTINVMKELKNIAAAHKLKTSDLNFKLLRAATFYSDDKTENVEVTPENSKIFQDEIFMLNPHLRIFQHYRIEIFQIEKEPIIALPEITLSGNQNLTRIIALVSKSHEVIYAPQLEQMMIDDIQNKMIRAGILVGVRDQNLYKEVKKIVAQVRINGHIEQNNSFVVCAGIDAIPSINGELVFHYKKRVNTKNAEGKVDYSKRGFILAVEEGECIIEYIKPQMGRVGRNCRGQFLPIREPHDDVIKDISITENIIKKESDTSIKYIAKRGGYVNVDKGNYDIQDQMEINEISFRSTGSVDANLDSNIRINIKEKDILKDAIGAGMSVETTELHVQSNVGSGAKIRAKIAFIGGQTHQSAYIESEELKIAVHRGEAIGQKIDIDRLEGGRVNGDVVHVKQMIGGEVVARVAKIDQLMSNAKITASEIIEIVDLGGNNNKLLIDPSVTQEFNERIDEIKKKIERLETELKAYPRQLSSKKEFIEKNKPMAEMVKDKIIELKKSNVEPPLTLYAKIKDFQEKVTEYNQHLQTFKDKKEELTESNQELVKVQNRVFGAKIINHSAWREFNEVRFKLIYPPQDITYSPKEMEAAREIKLKDIGNGEYRIIRSGEYS